MKGRPATGVLARRVRVVVPWLVGVVFPCHARGSELPRLRVVRRH